MAGEEAGDFHDIIDLKDGRVAVVVGDAPGFGPSAAAIAEDLRSELRRAFRVTDDLATVLGLLDERMRTHGDEVIATAACAVVDPMARSVRVANAGHLPLLFTDGGRVEVFDGPSDPPLGIAARRRTASRTLDQHTALFMYTDGLVERRGTPLDESLAALVSACEGIGEAASWAPEFARRATDMFGQPSDDATVVSVRLGEPASGLGSTPGSAVAARAPDASIERVLLRVFVDPADFRSRSLQNVVADLARRLEGRFHVDVEVVDVTSSAMDTEDEGVLAAPTIVRVAPRPPVRVIGWFNSATDLAHALQLPVPKEDR
jgi:hypothetical protein